jgi:hypothetical protein
VKYFRVDTQRKIHDLMMSEIAERFRSGEHQLLTFVVNQKIYHRLNQIFGNQEVLVLSDLSGRKTLFMDD